MPASIERRSCPFFSKSACFRLRATRESTCSADGTGTVGGGPEAVMGLTVAGRGAEVWRHRGYALELQTGFLPRASVNCVMRFMSAVFLDVWRF